MVVAIIALLAFLLLVGGMIFAVVWQLKRTDEAGREKAKIEENEDAQSFLPFEDIKDGTIMLGEHKYRAIIECTSTNYNLKTDKEKEVIEASFQRFLNSLTFPITMYVQTKMMDHSDMIQLMEKEIQEVIQDHPQLETYANMYYEEMKQLHTHIGNNKQKKKYIIVPFDEAAELADLSDEEKHEYSVKEIHNRAQIIVEGLAGVGVKGTILNTVELAELVYSTFHKDNVSHVDNIVNGEFLTMIVERGDKNPEENMTEDARLDWILYEAQMRIQTELLNSNLPDYQVRSLEKSIKGLDQLRDEASGYYRQRDVYKDRSFEGNHDGDIGKQVVRNKIIQQQQGGN